MRFNRPMLTQSAVPLIPLGAPVYWRKMGPVSTLMCLSLALASARVDTATYRWPLDIEPRVSSTFAECRDGHFHAGIDLGTFRRRGFRVRAVAPGWVWRVKTSPVGYGKALYLRLDDGSYAVYAHLSRFSPQIAKHLWEAQEKEGTYHVDAFFPPHLMRVQAGDVVAYTGDSGAGGPHLHFELRDSLHCPVNPLLSGFRVTDTKPPMVRRLALVPLDGNARVDGQLASQIVYFRVSDGELVQMSTPVIWGRIGVEAWAYDYLDASGNRVGVHSLDLHVDDRRVFGVQYDRFSYDEFYHFYLHYDRALRLAWKGNYARLHRRPWDRLPFHASESASGVLAAGVAPANGEVPLPPGRHVITVVARDASGNTRSAHVNVVVNAPPTVTLAFTEQATTAVGRVTTNPSGRVARVGFFASSDGGRHWERSVPERTGEEWYLNVAAPPPVLVRLVAEDSLGGKAVKQVRWPPVACPSPENNNLDVRLRVRDLALVVEVACPDIAGSDLYTEVFVQEGDATPVLLETRDYQHFWGTFPLVPALRGSLTVRCAGIDRSGNPMSGRGSLVLQPLSPQTTATAFSADSLAGLSTRPEDLHHLLYAFITRVDAGGVGELSVLGHAYAMGPEEASFAKKVRVFVALPAGHDPTGVGLFRREGAKQWAFQGAAFDQIGRGEISALVRDFGTFALLRDTEPPRVTRIRPWSGQKVGRSPTLEALVTDAGCGIDYETSCLELDGQRVVTEYIPERSRLVGHLGAALSPGAHRLVVTAKDRLGNVRVVERTFVVG
jgi:hypothetical protein